MSFRPSTGRTITVEPNPKTTRALLRRHLKEERKRIIDLSPVWGMHDNSTYRRFYDARPFTPQMIDSAITYLRLDDFDAHELRRLGAIEAGWQLNKGAHLP